MYHEMLVISALPSGTPFALCMLQSIFGISQSLGLTKPTSQSIRLPETTSQYIGLPKYISHSLELPEKYVYFSHTLPEVKVSVITASFYLISYIKGLSM